MEKKQTFIIWAPSYDENSGGAIALHLLCHTLNNLGERSVIWPGGIDPTSPTCPSLAAAVKEFNISNALNTPIASLSDLRYNSIVVYPEIVAGNPLCARNVVRWLLHRPGFHTGVVDYGKDELFFKFEDFCEDESITSGKAATLRLFWLNPLYQDGGKIGRSGSCYLLRKGKDKPLIHDLENSKQIDGLPHAEIAQIFNQKEIFYSYDENTLYSQLAAICGCTSVVIPGKYKNREDWVRSYSLGRYGIAYGFDDIEHALATKHLVLEYLKDVEREGIRSAEIFIAKSKTYFSGEQGCSFCAGMDRQMACVADGYQKELAEQADGYRKELVELADGYQKELAKANERLEALNAELSKVRRNPFTNLYLFCAWHLSREIQGLAPILSRSFIERMKRREKKISPESVR